MAHELEVFDDGSAAFLSAREDPWHRLGTTLPENFTAEQAMKKAFLGKWNVRKVPVVAQIDANNAIEIEGKFATVRNNPKIKGQVDVLGIVGEWYNPIQNEEHAEFLNALVDESGAHFETAGSLREGTQVFITMKLPKTMKIGGVDEMNTYIAAMNSHDGSSAFQAITTPVRVVCANTQAAALRAAKSSFVIRHTDSSEGRIAEAREALKLSFKYLDAFEAEAEKMIQTTMKEADFVKACRKLIPARDKTELSKKRYENKLVILADLFTGGAANENIRGTRWSAYQTITEYLDHMSPVRGHSDSSKEGLAAAATRRAEKSLTKLSTLRLKSAAFDAFAVK